MIVRHWDLGRKACQATRQRGNRLGTALSLLALTLGAVGCARTPFPPTAAPPNYGNPWTNPAGATALPPPTGYPGAVPPTTSVAPPGGLPSVPALPPADGVGPIGPPTGYGGFNSPPAGSMSGAANGLALPDLANPGTMQQQQQRALEFDPYANNDAAPEIVGGRPREFQKPLPEPVRARGFRDTRWPF